MSYMESKMQEQIESLQRRIAELEAQRNKDAELIESQALRLGRDALPNWKIQICAPNEDNPWKKLECQIVDVGVSDKILVVECKELTEAQQSTSGDTPAQSVPDGYKSMLLRWITFGKSCNAHLSRHLIAESEAMLAAAPKPAQQPDSKPSEEHEYSEGQWWIVELDRMVNFPLGTYSEILADTKRAVAVVHRLIAEHNSKPSAQVPEDVLKALNRMCQPLHESMLAGATAREDARCMAVIRDYVLNQSQEG